jgi:hypothetical protein
VASVAGGGGDGDGDGDGAATTAVVGSGDTETGGCGDVWRSCRSVARGVAHAASARRKVVVWRNMELFISREADCCANCMNP